MTISQDIQISTHSKSYSVQGSLQLCQCADTAVEAKKWKSL